MAEPSEPVSLPPLFAVVVNYNGWGDTLASINSLTASDYPDVRVLVMDNASTDDSVARLAGCADAGIVEADALIDRSWPPSRQVLLARCSGNLGFAGANNVALRYIARSHASALALLFNNDAVIEPRSLRRMAAMLLSSSDAAAVGATVLRHDRPDTVEMLAGARVSRRTGMVTPLGAGMARSAPRPQTLTLDYVSGCCLLTTPAVIERVGVMDERYFLYSEDVDWGLRMRGAGLRLLYCPDAEVWHKGGASVVHRSGLHDYYVVRGALMLVRKHFPARLPIALVFWLLRGMAPKMFRREWRRLAAAAKGYRDFVRGTVGPAARTIAR